MVKYPNGKKKATNIKIINYGNRGMSLESIINEANSYYLEKDIAVIYKKPTNIGINKSYDNKITSAYFKEKSTLDYNGVYKGKYIEFDAKETKNNTSFPLNNIHDHQLKHINNIINHGGISFIIISMNSEFLLLDGNIILDFIKSNTRKSIPYEYIKEKAYKIEYNYVKGLDYIMGLNKLLEEYK